MLRLISLGARAGAAVSAALVVLAAARWSPFDAETLIDVRALPLAPWVLGFAVVAALTGKERPRTRWRSVALLFGVGVAALLLAVFVRGPMGLPATVADAGVVAGQTRPGRVRVIGPDVRRFDIRRLSLSWSGDLRVPESGPYVLWVQGRGSVRVSVGGWPVLEAEGPTFQKEAELAMASGTAPLEVHYRYRGQGPRLRLGWTRPDGRREVIPPRSLGPRGRAWTWPVIDGLALLVALLAGVLVFLAPWDTPPRLPLPTPVTVREAVVVCLGYLLLLAVMSWPLVRDPVHTGPMYTWDGRLNAWILAWAGHALWTAPSTVFQAPQFHPLPDTLAFSESLLLPGFVAAPFTALGGAVLGYNLVFLVSLILSGLGVHLLARRAGATPLAAFTGGALFAAGSHRWTRLAHIQAQVTVFLPLALLALDRFWEKRTVRRALAVGLLVALQGLSSVYLGAITAAAVALTIAVGVFGGLRVRDLLRLGVGLLLASAVLWPSAAPYFRMRAFEGQEFHLGAVQSSAATLASYAAGGTHLWGAVTRRELEAPVTDALFPGLVVLLLAVSGLAVAPRRYRAVGLTLILGGVLLSLGPATGLYRWLHEHVVLVRSVRVLTRFALLPTMVLAVLAGLALTGRRRAAVLLALVAMMAESSNLPLRLSRDDGPPPAARWLAGHEGAVAYVPVGQDDTQAMLDGLAHMRPLVNGYGAFRPRPYNRSLDLLGGRTLDDEALRLLRAIDVRHVVSTDRLDLPVAAQFERQTVYEVPAGPAAAAVPPGEPAPTRWTAHHALVDLGAVQRVSGLVFEQGDGPWPETPRVEVSRDGRGWEEVDARASLADATVSLYQDPRRARAAVRFAPREARMLRVDRTLPMRPGALESLPRAAQGTRIEPSTPSDP